MWDFHAEGNWQWRFLIFLGLRWPIRSYNKHSNMFFDIESHWKPLELEEWYHWWLLFQAAATWPKITAGIFVDLADLLPDNIPAQEINSKRFWRENWWLVAFGYSICCRVSNVTKAQSVNTNPSQSSWFTLFFSPWTFTTIQCFGLPAVSGFLDSHMLLSSPSTPTLIQTSTWLSAISKQSC